MNENLLWSNKASTDWNEAYPIGNGRLGAMVFGGTTPTIQKCERIQLNEDTIWHGVKRDRHNPDAYKYLNEIRELLLAGKTQEALQLSRMAYTSNPKRQGAYLPCGDLYLTFDNHHDKVSHYKRDLNLESAIAGVEYCIAGVSYKRTHFVSAIDQVIVMKIESDQETGISMRANLCREQFEGISGKISDDTVYHNFQASPDGVKVCMMAKAVCSKGQVRTIGDFVEISESNSVVLFIAINTDVYGEDPQDLCEKQLNSATNKGYEKVLSDHISDYQSYYSRMKLSLVTKNTQSEIPTSERLEKISAGNEDPGMVELYFNFGRYLLISCSRPGTMAANLQGIWNGEYIPPWGSKYTININAQMNYWPAEVCNLSDCHQPFFDLIQKVRISGRETAQKLYKSSGFVAHHNTDHTADTAPVDPTVTAAIWAYGGAWLVSHLWEHYLFTQNKEFLKHTAYPTMKEAAHFLLDYMFEDSKGQLLSGPSVSPENEYYNEEGIPSTICLSPAMDREITLELFHALIDADKILEQEDSFIKTIQAAMAKIPPISIGKHGQIMEWLKDYDEPEPGHRHISHLYSLFPGKLFSKSQTPELFEASNITLERRLSGGGGHTGWSRAWITLFRARLNQGDEVYDNLVQLFSSSTYPNLFDKHPPFQIDGNFGATAGIAEMLIQSHEEEIVLLPALPQILKDGSVTGLCTRGAFVVDFIWENHKIIELKVESKKGGSLKVRQFGYEDLLINENAIAGNQYKVPVE